MVQQDIYISLDIGSSNVKVLIGEMSNGQLHVIGVGNVKSNGIRKGTIVDIEATVQSIKKAVEQAERMTGIKVERVVLGVPANQVALQPVRGVVAVNGENREISEEDLNRVIDSAQVMSIAPDREIVNILPTQFIVDHLDGIKDPRGMIGIRLEMDGLLVTTSKTILHNILRCVERAGLEVVDIYLTPLAAGTYALTEDEVNQGTAFIDFGGGSTTIAVFNEGQITHTAVIPVGGDHITKDLSIVLKTPTEHAEKIKQQYGHAFIDDASDDELFDVPVVGAENTVQYSQRYISEIIGVRLEELFELILDEFIRLGIQDLPGGIVITGGVTKLEGIAQLARQCLQTRVRVYSPDYIGVRDPAYTSAVGLIRYAYDEDLFFNREVGPTNQIHPTEVAPTPNKSASKQPKEPKMGVVERMKNIINNFFE